MLEETTPRTSKNWVPHSTFAEEMGLTDKGMPMGHAEEVARCVNEKAVV